MDVDIVARRISSELLAQLAAYLLAAFGNKALLGRTLLGRVEIHVRVTGLSLAPLVDVVRRGALDALTPQLVAGLLLADDQIGLTAAVLVASPRIRTTVSGRGAKRMDPKG